MLVKIDAAGRCQPEEIAQAKAFLKRQFSETDTSDAEIQRHLLRLLRPERSFIDDTNCRMAELCLRCFISSQIEQVCTQIATQFGGKHGFNRHDLFPYVLEDDASSRQRSYKPFSIKILETFDLERGSLNSWTTRRVKHHRELNAFLLERGVYLVSDWAVLNDTSPKQLQRIFSEFYGLSVVEIQQACILLESYHVVYRRDRLLQRGAGSKGKCLPPTVNQLQQIAHLFQEKANLQFSPEGIMTRLQNVAKQLRQYRISVRGGCPSKESLDDGEISTLIQRIHSLDEASNSDDEEQAFLTFYRQQFIACLDEAMEQVTRVRLTYLQRKNAQKAEQFITAIELFHSQGLSMSEIAPIVGLQAQYQVTNLLKLNSFRADIQQQTLEALLSRVLDRALKYAAPECLQTLARQVKAALDEQIAQVIQEAKAEASTARNGPLISLFAERLCHHLDAMKCNKGISNPNGKPYQQRN